MSSLQGIEARLQPRGYAMKETGCLAVCTAAVKAEDARTYMISEALAMHDGRASLVVLLFRDPHLLKCRERSQDGAADPD